MNDVDGSAPRPRPQYGEYATPEEVAEITGRRPDAVEPIDVHPGTTVPVAASGSTESTRHAAPTAPRPVAAPTERVDPAEQPPPLAADRIAGKPVPRFRLDRPIAWGLLAAGVVGFLLSAGEYLNYATSIRASVDALEPFGYGEFGAAGLANDLGPWVGTTHLLLLLLTVGVTVAASRRLRTVFWIPLVGFAVWSIAQSVFILVIFLNDPGYQKLIGSFGVG